MKIYTKTGDQGETGIIGKRISKSSLLIEAIGCLDELNAALGVIASDKIFNADVENQNKVLLECQNTIFDIGAILANGKSNRDFRKITELLEKSIDQMELELPKLQNFILPGGAPISAHIHLSRSICRRVERRVVELLNQNIKEFETLKTWILPFINRLSDYLFVLARYTNFKLGYEDIIWESSRRD